MSKSYFNHFGIIQYAPIGKPKTPEEKKWGIWTTGNPHLHQGQFVFMLKLAEHPLYSEAFIKHIDFAKLCMRVPGLFGRFPKGHHAATRDENGKIIYVPWTDTVSHDEYLGLLLLNDPALDSMIEDYGRKNNWSFDDFNPNKFTLKYMRLPKDLYYYRVAFNEKPYWIDSLHFNASLALSINRPRGYRNEGNKILSWFKIKLCEEHGRIPSCADWFRKKAIKDYGDNWLWDWFNAYFRFDVYKDHPFNKLVKAIKNKW